MKKSVIGGVAAAVVIGGVFAVNSTMNSKAQNAVNKFIVNANQESQYGKITVDNIQCSVLFSDSCIFNGFKFENQGNPEQSFKAKSISISGIKSFIGREATHQSVLPVGKTQVDMKVEGIRSLDNQTLSDLIATESPKFYSALTDEIKKALKDNDFFIEANVKNDVSSASITSDDKVSLKFNHLPLSLTTQIKYTYTGDQSVLRDPQSAVHNQGNIFGILGSLVVNHVSVSVEQGKYMFTDVLHGFYSDYIDKCAEKEVCIQRSNASLPEPYNNQDKQLTKDEFEQALVKVVDSRQGEIYQQIERTSGRSFFTEDEIHQIADFVVKGDRTMKIKLVNKHNAPVLGFADVIGRGMHAIRNKVDVEIQ
ncbi:hypothetical protein [Vibrio salinus]|uniref:hypothetical protein n=1 Tax=Vibrio salinus TaxID=2899784 RepID=UPI001E32E640|nr:hypothetical protein [Vibrio salinus]MCE0493133.1 hypothetical protein [Vibrio salinus]